MSDTETLTPRRLGRPPGISGEARRRQMLRAIADGILAEGRAPSVNELKRLFDFRSTESVTCHLRKLRDRGLIEWEPGLKRGIRLVGCRLAIVYDRTAAGKRMRRELEGD